MTRPVAPESLLSSAKEMQINWTRSSGKREIYKTQRSRAFHICCVLILRIRPGGSNTRRQSIKCLNYAAGS